MVNGKDQWNDKTQDADRLNIPVKRTASEYCKKDNSKDGYDSERYQIPSGFGAIFFLGRSKKKIFPDYLK